MIVFSNDHSWLRGKTLKYRWCILIPEERQIYKKDNEKEN